MWHLTGQSPTCCWTRLDFVVLALLLLLLLLVVQINDLGTCLESSSTLVTNRVSLVVKIEIKSQSEIHVEGACQVVDFPIRQTVGQAQMG